ncbi:hypothetical protein CP556_22695 [Natrinema sp. CBA1119]|nr:hypothetical protein CP556_22695 [Natrinema sp. CBA1119]
MFLRSESVGHVVKVDFSQIITMGCTVAEFNPKQYGVESRVWNFTNPEGKDTETVRDVRDEVQMRVEASFNEIEEIVADQTSVRLLRQRVSDAISESFCSKVNISKDFVAPAAGGIVAADG